MPKQKAPEDRWDDRIGITLCVVVWSIIGIVGLLWKGGFL